MKLVFTRAWVAVVVTILALAMSPTMAIAQSTSYLNAPAPDKIAVTQGGVDIRTARYTYNKVEASAGGDGNDGLTLRRTMTTAIAGHASPFGNFSHNYDILLMITSQVRADSITTDYQATVNFDGHSQTFQRIAQQDTAFEETTRNELTSLTTTPNGPVADGQIYTFTAVDGTIAVFRPLSGAECSDAGSCAFVSYVIQPDGTRLTFDYESTTAAVKNKVRLRSVTSSRD